ncbi:hypothetical protein DICA3_B07822 [Diutina catenulata]
MSHESRRMNRRNTEFPLTNQNLSTLRGGTSPRGYYAHGGAVALDMDDYAREQGHFARSQTWSTPFDEHLSQYEGDESDYGFGESNPSSEGDDDDQSVDDVFIDDEHRTDNTQWPKLDELESFITEEIDEILTEAEDEPSPSPGPSTKPQSAPYSPTDVQFGHATIASPGEAAAASKEPLLRNYRLNDLEELSSPTSSLRVTPKPIQPWDHASHKQKKSADLRFTYFREDKEKTVHASTLSGLVTANNPNAAQPLSSRLKELFVPRYYSETDKDKPAAAPAASPSGIISRTSNSNTNLTNLSALTSTQGGTEDDDDVFPFWLDILDPTEEEMKVISKTFNIHPLTTEDIYLGEGREKVELFNNYYFVCFTSFDVVYERRILRHKEKTKKMEKLREMLQEQNQRHFYNPFTWFSSRKSMPVLDTHSQMSLTQRKVRSGELVPLNMYMVVFKEAILTFHMSQTPHPINVRRRARLLKDHIKVTSDWISYALIDDITDSFAPMIESIEDEVNAIEDAILRMQSTGDSESESDSEDDEPIVAATSAKVRWRRNSSQVQEPVFFKPRKRSKSTIDINGPPLSHRSSSSSRSSSRSTNSGVLRWRKQGDMLRRIGECRKRVMSVLRLLGAKADVVKSFAKRFNEQHTGRQQAMYLGDIQDHIVTMVQALNHYEKLLARFHANYLAQINIDMTKVNNDTNDVLGKLTVMGTIVLPLNVITGLWGMNCLVPGQEYDGLAWFWGIIACMTIFSMLAYNYARKVTGL